MLGARAPTFALLLTFLPTGEKATRIPSSDTTSRNVQRYRQPHVDCTRLAACGLRLVVARTDVGKTRSREIIVTTSDIVSCPRMNRSPTPKLVQFPMDKLNRTSQSVLYATILKCKGGSSLTDAKVYAVLSAINNNCTLLIY